MKKFMKWAAIAFVTLAVIGAFVPKDKNTDAPQATTESTTTESTAPAPELQPPPPPPAPKRLGTLESIKSGVSGKEFERNTMKDGRVRHAITDGIFILECIGSEDNIREATMLLGISTDETQMASLGVRLRAFLNNIVGDANVKVAFDSAVEVLRTGKEDIFSLGDRRFTMRRMVLGNSPMLQVTVEQK